MGAFHTPQITDDLLSAYIDDIVSHDERSLVERALAADPEVAWRLETLRHTISLLKQLSPLVLPHSFSISELDVAKTIARRRQIKQSLIPFGKERARFSAWTPRTGKIWVQPGAFWRAGNPFLRNVATLCLVLCLILIGGDRFLTPSVPGVAIQTDLERSASIPQSGMGQQAQPNVAGAQSTQPIASPLDASSHENEITPRTLGRSVRGGKSIEPPIASTPSIEEAPEEAPIATSVQSPRSTAFSNLEIEPTQVRTNISSALLLEESERGSFFDPYRRQLSQFGFGFLLLLLLSLWWISRSAPQTASQLTMHS